MSTPAATTTTGRRGLWRWSVALAATAALVISGSGLVAFAQSGSGESQGPVFVLADAPMYVEARLDMPAGQDEALAQMLTAFPGFADPGAFDMKMDQLIAGVSGDMGPSLPADTVFGDIFTGEIGIALTDLDSSLMGSGEPSMLLGMPIASPDLATVMTAAIGAGVGMEGEAVTETYNDVAIVTDVHNSMAVHGDWMLISDTVEGVQSAIDTLDAPGTSMADDPDFQTAFARLPDARLGGMYVDFSAFGPMLDLAGILAEGQAGMELPMADLGAMLPTNMSGYLAAADDRMNLEVFVTPGEATPDLPLGESELANLFPAETQLYVEVRELGAAVETTLDGVAELMAAQEAMAPVEDGALGGLSDIDMLFSEESPITSMLGVPLPQFLDFVEDAGIGAGLSSDGLWLGIAGEISETATAEERVRSVLSLIRLFGGNPAESGISVETAMVGDVEVASVTVPLDDMMAESGVPITVGNTISVAVAGDTLLLGTGDFVEGAIVSDGSDSLGASEGYNDALSGDTVNSGLVYANISSLLAALDPMLSLMSPEWSEISPYATGLDRMIAVGSADDEVMSSRMTVIVNQ